MPVTSPAAEAAETQQNRTQRAAIVGQLVGGVLHDFNNILTVITGTIEILAEAVADRPDLVAIARLIDEAASRGARLTSHLLAFARGQPSQPGDVEVNALLAEAIRLLRPALGGDIELASITASGIAPALADPGQLMAAVLSLAIQARNAMPEGGKLTFETKEAGPEPRAAAAAADTADPGRVVIAVTACRSGASGDHSYQVFADLDAIQHLVRQFDGCVMAGQQNRTAEIRLIKHAGQPARSTR